MWDYINSEGQLCKYTEHERTQATIEYPPDKEIDMGDKNMNTCWVCHSDICEGKGICFGWGVEKTSNKEIDMRVGNLYELIKKEVAQQDYQSGYKEMGIADYLMRIRFNLSRADNISCEETERHALEYIRMITALGIRCLQQHGCPEPKAA